MRVDIGRAIVTRARAARPATLMQTLLQAQRRGRCSRPGLVAWRAVRTQGLPNPQRANFVQE